MDDTEELVFELEPRRFKSFAEADVRTALGKRNRIAIGRPLCTPEGATVGDGLLEDGHLIAYPIDDHSFYRLRFDVTLLPDHECRFVAADLVLVLEPTSPKDNVPLFLKLSPVDAETGARLSSFGTGTREAGWRFERTEAAAIPLSTRGMEALVVLTRGAVGKMRFRLAAKIDVHSTLDNWMTRIFSRGLPAIADYEFPTTNERERTATTVASRESQEQDIAEVGDRLDSAHSTLEPQITSMSRSLAVRILFLGANPSDTTRLSLDREVREIDLRLLASEHRDTFRIEQSWAVRAADLQACLLRHRPTIVHFSGHGNSAGELLFEDETGTTTAVTPIALRNLFRILRKDIRCVLLNACFSEPQARAIAEHIDCVIGMTTAVEDRSAVAFAGAFYQALGFGEDVHTAFDLGCNQMDLVRMQGGPRDLAPDAGQTGAAQANVPRLLVREGIRAQDIRFAKASQMPHTVGSKL